MASSGLSSVLSLFYFDLQPLDTRFGGYISVLLEKCTAPLMTRPLKALLGFWVLSRVNHALNIWARNHWCIRKAGQPWNFNGNKEVAVVTGGSGGFGLLIAKGLSQHCRVAVLDVLPLPEELQKCPNITFYHCDLTSLSAIHKTAEAIRSDLGHPSILINNAGVARPSTIVDEDDEFLERIFKVNIISHFVLIKEFLPMMLKQQKGHIVSIASVGSYMSGPPLVNYCSTKAAVLALHEGLKGELRQIHKPNGRCIQTTMVHPAVHGTGMLKSLQQSLTDRGGQVLPASNVANAVIEQVLSGRGNQIFAPPSAVIVSFLRVLPAWLQELLRDWGVGSC